MGTISYLKDRLRAKSRQPQAHVVTVNAHGFAVGPTFVPWQMVSEIRAWKVDPLTTDEAFLGFLAGSNLVSVSEDQAGFAELEAAMVAVFPDTAGWREAVRLPAFARNETVLYRRC